MIKIEKYLPIIWLTIMFFFMFIGYSIYFLTGTSDSVFEQAAESMIKNKTGIEIDLTPN